ncbi:GAF domain-containing protein [Sphingomonas sp. SUN019]|uniref:GAF domain-containing protein n=1 Tax=Sphingomonas sp. SUN019 TaxID=2937788 RepID=UPI002164AA9C|nr:GAF domain-containing protein [Sphingomonas sp. SUN019]UVO51901.1 GAF domain-containing protein [Sphingomonas sp. SUN019]
MGASEDEGARIADLQHEAILDDIADIAARACGCPVAVISLVDDDRIGLKTGPGTDGRARAVALCGTAVMEDDPWVVDHPAVDPRTLANPLVAAAFGLRFHAGVPLRSPAGYDLGTLAVMDRAPRTISDDQIALLKKLAGLAVQVLEMRLNLRTARVADHRITSAA